MPEHETTTITEVQIIVLTIAFHLLLSLLPPLQFLWKKSVNL